MSVVSSFHRFIDSLANCFPATKLAGAMICAVSLASSAFCDEEPIPEAEPESSDSQLSTLNSQLSDTELWNAGVDAYRAGDYTNAVAILRPLMLSKTHGARAAEVVAKIAHDESRKGEESALKNLEEAATAAQIALRANPDDERAKRNFTRAVDGLPGLRETKRINDIIAAAQNKDKGAMMRMARDEARQLLEESGTYRTLAAVSAVAKADALSARASKLADTWIPLKELVAQSITNQEEAAAIMMHIDTAREKTSAAAKALGDMEDGAYSTLSEVEQDFSRFHKMVAMPPDAIAQDFIAQSNAWMDVESINGNNWQQDALDYTQAFRQKFPMWAQQYEQAAQADTNRPPFTAEQQAEISSLSTQLEKLQLECVKEILPPKQEEAVSIIKRIMELMPPEKGGGGGQGQQNQQQNQNQQNQQNQDQQNQDQQQNDQEQNEDLGNAPEQQEEEQEQQAQEAQEDEKTPDDKEVEDLLKKAQERTDEHEEDKRRRMRRATLPPNERDW